jgi:2-succinyl-5-enolpyruvyl-6-hydroxy-3-cyclohexene-1-carboxylate synthase
MNSLDFRNTNTVWCGVLVETLARLGLRRAVISPGSRSAPLTFALARNPRIEAIPVLDERSAAFYALGLAKQSGVPVALVCTSGTAAANFLPAIVEAHESGVPLLVLTADRPPELRDCHSGQSINQQHLYGSFVNYFRDLPVPAARLAALRGLRREMVHAFRMTSRPMTGPVHLNCPFRDPLPPLAEAKPHDLRARDLAGFFRGVAAASVATSRRISPEPRPRPSGEGVIVVGPNDPVAPRAFAAAVGKMSRALGWPVLADVLSPVRMHAKVSGHLVAHYDTILRSPRLAAELRPKRVICVGGWPTSKVLREWLKQANPATLLVTDRADNLDGLHLRTRHVRGDITGWCAGFAGQVPPAAHTRSWLAADRLAAAKLGGALAGARSFVEPLVVPTLARTLPQESTVFVASSMPVRDLEYFWPAGTGRQRIKFNRGANGIDGTLSTALGAAHGGRRPAVLLTGDLALLHDTNGFLSVPRFRGSLTIVLINNRGGGIFEHLPVAKFDPPFEEFFATPQRADFATLCAAYGVPHTAVGSAAQLGRLLAKLPKQGMRVLEVRTDRKRDAAWRKATFARVAAEL